MSVNEALDQNPTENLENWQPKILVLPVIGALMPGDLTGLSRLQYPATVYIAVPAPQG